MIQQASDKKQISQSVQLEHEWAIILAGGDGTRLKSLTRKIAGDERPKQFCSVLGQATLLEETQRRAALELARKRTLFVVNQLHQRYYPTLLADTDPARIISQPRNVGTAPAILYSLLRLAAMDSKSVVVFFPSDHYISDNRKFMSEIRVALNAAHSLRDTVFLLGLEPQYPEVEYGWIEPTTSSRGHESIIRRASVLGETQPSPSTSVATPRMLMEQLCHGCFRDDATRHRRGIFASALSLIRLSRASDRKPGRRKSDG